MRATTRSTPNVSRATRAEVICALDAGTADPYFFQLALYHEDMHCEALHYTLQTLGVPPPSDMRVRRGPPALGEGGELHFPGGDIEIGSRRDSAFVFDNELDAHEFIVEPFAISRTAVANGEFAAFVDEGGYGRKELPGRQRNSAVDFLLQEISSYNY